MDTREKLAHIKRKIRLRLAFAAFTMMLYFSYALNYTAVGSFLGDPLGESHITGSLAMYVGLIALFIVLELIFLGINRDKKADAGAGKSDESIHSNAA